jgi:hypothetical protein
VTWGVFSLRRLYFGFFWPFGEDEWRCSNFALFSELVSHFLWVGFTACVFLWMASRLGFICEVCCNVCLAVVGHSLILSTGCFGLVLGMYSCIKFSINVSRCKLRVLVKKKSTCCNYCMFPIILMHSLPATSDVIYPLFNLGIISILTNRRL